LAERYNNINHGKYVCELTAAYSVFKVLTKPQIGALGSIDLGGANFTVGYTFVDQPHTMVPKTHKHDFDQVLIFLGRDSNCVDFDSETDVTIEDEVYHITYPCCIFLPRMTWHNPTVFKRITKPIMFFDIVLHPVPSLRENQIIKS